VLPILLVVAACGGGTMSAASIQKCVREHVPPGAIDRVFTNTEAGVTSVNYFHDGAETDLSVFPSAADAEAAEKAEARLGDAHDRRLRNVLYSGGGVIEQAIVDCVG
jgi:hypothetical protein